MIGGAMYTTIKTLWERNKNKSKIAKETKHDWKTVAKVIKSVEAGEQMLKKKEREKELDKHKEKIINWLEENLNGLKIYEKLIEEGIKISYSSVKKYIKAIKKRTEIFVRFITEPGEEAQVDFGYIGLTPDNKGKKRRTWVFCMQLSYSRLAYYEIVYDQKVETFIQCHINAFKYFGGVPKYIKIDNLKAAILEANFYEPVYQELYKRMAEYYGFSPLPCRVERPNDKGKVESGIKYFKINFMLGRKFKDREDLENQKKYWLEHTCNSRVHGTTRKVPRVVFESEEKDKLNKLPLEDFKISAVGTRKAYHDCHIFVEYNYYSVPFEYVGKEVEIDLSQELLKINYQSKEIAVHQRLKGRGEFSTNPSHYPKYKMYSDTEYQEKYQIKMAEIGEYAEQLFLLIKEKHPQEWSRTVCGVLSLIKEYPKEIVNKSCKRAIAYDVCQYQIIKNICKNGSYNLPMEFNFQEGQ